MSCIQRLSVVLGETTAILSLLNAVQILSLLNAVQMLGHKAQLQNVAVAVSIINRGTWHMTPQQT